jgi:hypothetical protein
MGRKKSPGLPDYVAETNPTSVIKTRAFSPDLVAIARFSSATMATPVSDMSLMRPVESAPLVATIQIGSSSLKTLLAPTYRRLQRHHTYSGTAPQC